MTLLLFLTFLVPSRIHGSFNLEMLSRSWDGKASPQNHSTTTMFDCWHDVIQKCHPKFTFDSSFHWGVSQKVCGTSRGFCKCAMMFLLVAVVCYSPSIFIVESWTLSLAYARSSWSSFSVLLGYFVTSWISCHLAFGEVLAGWPLLGRFTIVPCVLDLEVMSPCSSVECMSLRNVLGVV